MRRQAIEFNLNDQILSEVWQREALCNEATVVRPMGLTKERIGDRFIRINVGVDRARAFLVWVRLQHPVVHLYRCIPSRMAEIYLDGAVVFYFSLLIVH